MDRQCVAPSCQHQAVALIKQEWPVCLDHYKALQLQLQRLDTTLATFEGTVPELLTLDDKRTVRYDVLTRGRTLHHPSPQTDDGRSHSDQVL